MFVGRGSAPDPAGGAYSAPLDPLAGFEGPTSKRRTGQGGEREGKGRSNMGKGGGEEERGREGEGSYQYFFFSRFKPWGSQLLAPPRRLCDTRHLFIHLSVGLLAGFNGRLEIIPQLVSGLCVW